MLVRIQRGLSRFALALCVAVLALAAGAVEQQQLASTIVTVTLAEAGGKTVGHYMPDGTYMAGSMETAGNSARAAPRDAAGHTHKGHADCEVCGALAAMAAFTLPVIGGVVFPPRFALPRPNAPTHTAIIARLPAPYASRAPPANA